MALLPLAQADALRLADTALAAVRQRFPHKLDHLILHDRDLPAPEAIHPVFDGSYDWHEALTRHGPCPRGAACSADTSLRRGQRRMGAATARGHAAFRGRCGRLGRPG